MKEMKTKSRSDGRKRRRREFYLEGKDGTQTILMTFGVELLFFCECPFHVCNFSLQGELVLHESV